MRTIRTIFEHPDEPTHCWVQARPFINGQYYHISVRLTQSVDKGGKVSNYAFEITDFRPGTHTNVNWKWIDKNLNLVWRSIEFQRDA